MRETIRFAWGTSSLGDCVVAASGKGLVALEFSSRRAATEAALQSRLADADLVEATDELTFHLEQARRAIETPGAEHGLSLDLRGTPYQVEVWTLLREIPVGTTTHYGALARRLGAADARDVAEAIAQNQIAVLVPCHRVIKKDGSISGYRWGVKRKLALLAREQDRQPFQLTPTAGG